MTAAYHAGVIWGLKERFGESILDRSDRIVASSGAAAVYHYWVSGQSELLPHIFDHLIQSRQFVNPKKIFTIPPLKRVMNISYLVNGVVKAHPTLALNLAAYMSSPIRLEVGLTNYQTGESRYIQKDDPGVDTYELLSASCSVPHFADRDFVTIGEDDWTDGNIGSLTGIERVGDEENVMVVLTKPANPLPERQLLRKLAAWALMKNRPPQLQTAIWNMMTQFGSIPEQIDTLRENNKNTVVIQPQDDLPMWRIDPRLSSLRRTIEQGRQDACNHQELDAFFDKIGDAKDRDEDANVAKS